MKNPTRDAVSFRSFWPWCLIFFAPSLAQAHPGVPGHSHGVVNGFLHPLTGLDHICAMVAVGVWAAQRGGRMLWLVPATFVSLMVVGGILGIGGAGIPWFEQGIAASVLVLGLFIAGAVRLPLAVSAAVVGLFGLFHGYAHGVEMPETASGASYAAGFVLATAGLHMTGVGVGLAAQRFNSARLVRLAGGAIAMAGVYLCFA
jgi:urease accessory protein